MAYSAWPASLLGADAELANNIDATGTATWNAGAGFVPIGADGGAYTGTVSGQGNIVNGLTIYRAGNSDVGLSGLASGTIENVGVLNVHITGNTDTGGLVGALGNDVGATPGTGTIMNAYASGSVSGGFYTGRLVGLKHGTSVTACKRQWTQPRRQYQHTSCWACCRLVCRLIVTFLPPACHIRRTASAHMKVLKGRL